MIKIELPFVGSPRAAASYLLNQAHSKTEAVESDFNGSPMSALLSDSVDVVVVRWHYERLLIQIANGNVKVTDYADHRYLNRR